MNGRGRGGAADSLTRPTSRTIGWLMPIARWLPDYQWRRNLPADAIAGVAIAALLIPESMGYAGVAGVPTQVGLYAALAAVAAYAITGGVSILVVGPASAVAALSASIVAEFGGDADPVALTTALAITSGLLLMAAGALRLGWIVNFISRPVLEAFVAGLSISIIIGQLDGLFGVEVEGESAIARLIDVLSRIDAWHVLTAVVGIAAVASLILLERYAEKIPGAVIVVIAGIIAAVAFDLAMEGVAVVGEIPQGLPTPGIPDLSGTRWLELLGAATALLLVGFSEGYAAASAVAEESKEEVDADQELFGSGAANLASGLMGGLVVGGSLSKSAAAENAGARSQMANLVAGLIVLATLLFLAPVFENLPEPVLAAVVIVAVMGSADPRRVMRLWDVNRLDFAAGLVTFTLVLVWETLPAMIVGVVLSLAFVVRRASFPDVSELRQDQTGRFTVSGATPPESAGALVLRFEGPLIYANSERLKRATLRLVDRHPEVPRLVVDGEMMSDLDTSGAEMLVLLDEELAARDIALHLARIHHRARSQLDRSSILQRFEERIHPSIGDAVADIR
jgi:sulfate permease, SulP family